MSKKPSPKSTAWILSAALVLTIVVSLFGPFHRKLENSFKPDLGKSRTASSRETARVTENPTTQTAAPSAAAGVAATPTITNPPAQNPPTGHPAPTTHEDLPPDFLDRIVAGNKVAFTLPDGRQAAGGVEMIQRDARGVLFIQGRLTSPDPGFYFFQRQTVAGVAGPLVGNVRFDGKDDAWKIEPTADLSAARMNARKLDEIICTNYHKMPEAAEGEVEYAPQTHPNPVPIPYYQSIIPLQSLPGAIAVIYLDFDGEQGPFSGWGNFNAAPSGASNSQVFDVWKMVCEDYQGFNINITTDRKVFDNAPQGRRQHCIITPTTTAAAGAGGVSFVGSFNWSGETVNWAFYSTGKDSCEVIAHECGHALGLDHDGRNNPSEGYYEGHGSGVTGWAPIMGVGYYENLTQWSKGEYLSANQTQDDLSIIANNNNNVGYRPDDTGDTLATARYLEIAANNSVSNEGIIERTGDIDAFRFVTTGGQATLNANTVSLNPDLDILAEIVNASTNAVVASNNPDLAINASVSATLGAGEYLLRVRGTGRGNPLGDGYTNYGSLGSYLITGSVAGGVKSERFSIAENSANGTAVGTVVARNNHAGAALTYAIASGNSGGAFAIDSATGAITVANSSVLDFEALSLRWDDPATIEMFVTITDGSNSSLNENLRTVVTVTDLNEAPFITGSSLSILEHTDAGTNVFKVVANETDHFDFAKYSITAGNTGNVFAIDANTGQITLAANIDVSANTVYNLTVQAADQGTPPMTSTATVAITVLNIADEYLPGKAVRTYFENISGSTVANLTSNANFPNNPDSQEFLSSFDGQGHGDNFGSTVRGYLIPPTSGTYQFWIASDDASELRLSTNASPTSATVRATVAGATSQYAWTANSSQQSSTVSLTAGVAYYIEARHKEGGGGDHVAVAWTGPGITRQVIPGLYLAPYYQNYPPKTNAATYAVRENALAGQSFATLTSSDLNAQDTFSYTITGGNTGGVFGINPATGQLMVANSGLLNATTTPTYTLTIQSTDNGTPALSGSGTVTVNVLPASTITGTGIVQEIWTGISGTALSGLTGNVNYPFKPNTRRSLTSFDSGTGYADNYGSRIRVMFMPPTTDNYRFYLAGDDDCSLLHSASATGSGASQIASVSGWTDHNVWTKYASQTSAVKSLVAGQAVYLETLHKEGVGGDHVSVAYTNSTVTTPTVIPGTMLQPFEINAAPAFSPASYSYNVTAATATAGMVLGTATATEPNGETLVYGILSGNSQGAFAINSSTGVITVANPAGLSNGDAVLQVAAQDGGLGGVYPFASATATVVVHVTASNSAPVFVSNPVVKPGAPEDVAYSETLAGSATDVDAGDTLTFSKTSGPSWLAVAANGDLTGTPDVGSDGLNAFVVRVTDSSGIFAEATLTITVTGINHPPVFTVNPMTATAMYGVPIIGAITATDPNAGDTLTYSKLSGPAWLGVASNGTLTGTPASTDLGVNTFSVQVVDASGATADATLNVTVSDPVLYFDTNGATTGSGAPGSATWGGANTNWSAIPAGTGATQTWVSGAKAMFSAGADAGTSTITVSGTQTLRGLTIEEGTPALTGGTLSLTGTTPTITTGSGINASISSVITGSTGLKRDGDGSLTLAGAASNTYSGSTNFAGNGQLILSKTGGAVAIPGDLLMAAPGVRGIVSTTVDNQFAAGSVLRFTSTGDTRLELKGTTQTLGGIENTGVTGVYHCVQHSEFGTPAAVDGTSQLILNVAGSNSYTFNTASGSLRDYNGGVLSLVKSGTGTQTLSGGNVSYTGSTTISQGRLIVKDSGTAYDSLSTSIAPSAFLQFNTSASGNTQQLNNNGQMLTGTGTIEKTGPGQLWFGGNGQVVNISLGSGALIDVYDGILRNEYGVSGGGNWSANLADLNIRSTATVNVWDGNITVDGLTGTGIVEKGQAGTTTLTIGVDNAANPSFSGTIKNTTGTLAFIKTGTGSQTLGGANTYTGTTTVSQGSLIVTGSLANTATTVAAAGTLGGTGTIAGPVVNNGTLSPGTTSAGNLTVSNTLTLAPSSAIAWQVANWTGTAGTGYDKLTVNSLNLTATSTSTNRVTIRISQQALANFTETSKTFTLLQSTAAISGFDPTKFVLDTSGFTSGAGTWAVQQSGNTLVLAYTRANTVPTFANNPIAMAGTQGLAMSGSISGVDPDLGETLTYSKVSGPSWLAVASNGTLSGTPLNANVGPNSFTVRVTDSFNASTTATLNITVANVNDAPVFTNPTIAGSAATENAAYTGSLAGTATDPDAGDTLTFSKISGPSWLAVSSNGGLAGTPASGDVGANSFTVRATDTGGLFAEATLEIQVTASASSDGNANGILDAWEIEKFGNANPGSNPADGDPDHDGLTNLMEFAIGTHPAQANASPLALGFATVGPDKFLQLTVPKNPAATNIGFEVEASGDPGAGTWSAAPTEIVSETATTLIVRDATPVQSAGKRFLRLKVRTLP